MATLDGYSCCSVVVDLDCVKMGNSAGKENDINNLMHLSIVKDADLPKSEVEQNNASVWKEVNERYWELEMNQFNGFDEFNFFRAINPGFHTGAEGPKRAGMVVGDQETFHRYKDLYDFCYVDKYHTEGHDGTDTDDTGTDTDDRCEMVMIPDTRVMSCNANSLEQIEDITNLKRLYLKVERNIASFPLLPGISSPEQLQQIQKALVKACCALDGKHYVDPDQFVYWDTLKGGKMKKLQESGVAIKSTDPYVKSAGMLRWWPQGRAIGYGVDAGFSIIINEEEHLKMEWTSYGGDFLSKFHKFHKSVNNMHKNLKRQEIGGFWKDPKYGFISVDPGKFGTMFTVELDFSLGAIPTYFTADEISEDCADVLGIAIKNAEARNQYTIRAKEPQWLTEDEQFNTLLMAVNRLAQIDRSLYYSPRKPGDTLFKLNVV